MKNPEKESWMRDFDYADYCRLCDTLGVEPHTPDIYSYACYRFDKQMEEDMKTPRKESE